jgi:N-acetylneuraminic acid mutarotase
MKSFISSVLILIGVAFVTVALTACGGGGGGAPAASAPAQTIVAGFVQAPGGQVAFYRSGRPLEQFAAIFAPSAYAGTTGLSSVPDGTLVALGRMTSGGVVSTLETTTTSGGRYSFNLTSAGLVFANDLVVQVANPATGVRMRAFVTKANADITPDTESAVQIVLDMIVATPGSSLADFTIEEIRDVLDTIDALTASSQLPAGPDINSTIASIKTAVTSDPGVVAFLTSATASGQTAEGPGDVGNFAPYTQGNTWLYEGTEHIAGQPPINYTNTATISGTMMVGGVLTTIFNETNSLNTGGPDENYYTKDSRGLTYHGSNDLSDVLDPQLVPYLETRFPFGTGSTYEELNKTGLNFGEDLDGDLINETLDLVSTVTVKGFESVAVPAGTYSNSAKVERQIAFTVTRSSDGQVVSLPTTHTSWWAPGVGLVQQVLQSGVLTVSERLLPPGPWVSKAAMPTARLEFSTASLNGKVYAIGGRDASAPVTPKPLVTTVEIYDPSTDTWSSAPSLPVAAANQMAAAVNGKIYAIGGEIAGAPGGGRVVQEYDPVSQAWALKSDMPEARYSAAVAVINDMIYIAGGRSAGLQSSSLNWYDPSFDIWTIGSPMNQERDGTGGAAIGGEFVVYGGFATTHIPDAGYLRSVEIYDPVMDMWSSGADGQPRRDFGIAVLDGMMYTFGGNNVARSLDWVQTYDNVANKWVGKTAMPSSEAFVRAEVIGDRIYIFAEANTYEYEPDNDL